MDSMRALLIVALATAVPGLPAIASASGTAAGNPTASSSVVSAAAPAPGGSRYHLQLDVPENVLQFSVHVWGEVRQPGLYSVAPGATVLDVISLAGGPTSAARLKSVRLVRATDAGEGERMVKLDLERFVAGGGEPVGASILPDDTIVVEARSSANLLKWTGFLSVVALAANVVVNATR